MSEAARAQERLDFELAAEALEKANRGQQSNLSAQQSMDFLTSAGMQFTSAGIEVWVYCRIPFVYLFICWVYVSTGNF